MMFAGKLLSLTLILFLTSCTFLPKESKVSEPLIGEDYQTVKIYFTKSKEGGDLSFAAVTRKVPKKGSKLDYALRELFLGPTKQELKMGIMSEIPVGTRLIKIEESEDELLVDLSSQYLVGGGSASVQLRYLQLYKTLTTLEPRKKFYLHVDGKELKTIAGEGLEVTQPLTMINDYTKKYEKIDEMQS